MAERSLLITGCSSGIGACCAAGMQARGWRVIATARKPKDIEDLKAQGLEALYLDYTEPESITQCAQEALALTGGRLSALFNNGAYGQPGAVEDIETPVLREQFEANFFGWHDLTRQLIPAMRRNGGGRIVQNSSVLGLVSLKYRGAYNASKFAVEGLSDALRQELKGTGIHVAIIEPGPIESRFRDNAYAAFKRNVDPGASVHRQAYAAMERRLLSEGPGVPFTLPPRAVLRKVLHALDSPRPRVRYYVTFPTYLFAVLRRTMSHRMLDRVLLKVSG